MDKVPSSGDLWGTRGGEARVRERLVLLQGCDRHSRQLAGANGSVTLLMLAWRMERSGAPCTSQGQGNSVNAG